MMHTIALPARTMSRTPQEQAQSHKEGRARLTMATQIHASCALTSHGQQHAHRVFHQAASVTLIQCCVTVEYMIFICNVDSTLCEWDT